MRIRSIPWPWTLGAALILLVGGWLLTPSTSRADQPVITPTTQ